MVPEVTDVAVDGRALRDHLRCDSDDKRVSGHNEFLFRVWRYELMAPLHLIH